MTKDRNLTARFLPLGENFELWLGNPDFYQKGSVLHDFGEKEQGEDAQTYQFLSGNLILIPIMI